MSAWEKLQTEESKDVVERKGGVQLTINFEDSAKKGAKGPRRRELRPKVRQ
jgi:hypothetical protein